MPIQTLLISGPRLGGKTTFARLLKGQGLTRRLHYLRLQQAVDSHTNAVIAWDPSASLPRSCENSVGCGDPGPGWASLHIVSYTPDRVFETIPDGLRAVRRLDREAFVVVEADDDPSVRHAYPFEFRVFVMPAPADVCVVFRDPEDAASALQQVLHDTAAFATEMFGLFDDDLLDDGLDVHYSGPAGEPGGGAKVERLHLGERQMASFLSSPLGIEIASRIQLQPEYHALVEADFVLINRSGPHSREVLDDCVLRLQRLLSRIRQDARRQSVLYWGNLMDQGDVARRKLISRLRGLIEL